MTRREFFGNCFPPEIAPAPALRHAVLRDARRRTLCSGRDWLIRLAMAGVVGGVLVVTVVESHFLDALIKAAVTVAAVKAASAWTMPRHVRRVCAERGLIPVCPRCEYRLSGLPAGAGRCPECGARI